MNSELKQFSPAQQYDTLDRFNARTCSVESGFESTNEGFGVFDDEEEGCEKNYEVNNAYSSINKDKNVPPPPARSNYEQMNLSSAPAKIPLYAMHKGHVHSLPEMNTATSMNKISKQRQMIPLDARSHHMKKQNILYETSVTTQTQNQNVNGTKISITKQNSLTTSTHTTAPPSPPTARVLNNQRRRKRTYCGVPQTHCYLALNVVFGICALAALIIGVVVIVHQQENEKELEYVKETHKASVDKTTLQRFTDIIKTLANQVNKVDQSVGTFNKTLIQVVKQLPNKSDLLQTSENTFKDCTFSENSHVKKFKSSDDLLKVTLEVKAFAQKNTTIKGSSCTGTSTRTQLIIVINNNNNDQEQKCKCTGLPESSQQSPTMKCTIEYWICPQSK